MAYYRAVAQSAAPATDRIGVLLVNLGTPDTPSYIAVQRYLREFLSDRRIVGTPRMIWLPLLYGVILPFRPIRTARKYRKIWLPEGSPLTVYSKRLAARVAALLRVGFRDMITVALGMTYGTPSIAGAIQSLAAQGVKKLLILPLYPQYCSSTTGSAFDRASVALERWRWLPETRFVNGYHRDPGYIDAMASAILEHWSEVGERSHLVFSYRGTSAAAAAGDPYQVQCEATTRLIASRLSLAPADHSHGYQSRFGSAAWLQPYTQDTLKGLIQRGVRKVTVVSPSFAVDCLETLEEIGIEYRDLFQALGGERLTLVPALNDGAAHAQALAAIVKTQLLGWTL